MTTESDLIILVAIAFFCRNRQRRARPRLSLHDRAGGAALLDQPRVESRLGAGENFHRQPRPAAELEGARHGLAAGAADHCRTGAGRDAGRLRTLVRPPGWIKLATFAVLLYRLLRDRRADETVTRGEGPPTGPRDPAAGGRSRTEQPARLFVSLMASAFAQLAVLVLAHLLSPFFDNSRHSWEPLCQAEKIVGRL